MATSEKPVVDRRKIGKDEEIKIFHEYGVFPRGRIIKLNSVLADTWDGGESGVDSALFNRLDTNLDILESIALAAGEDPTITVRMSNPGGNAYHMFAIYDRIRLSPCPINMEVYGHAMSAATIFMQAADKRRIAPDARFMVHYGQEGFFGHAKDFERGAEESRIICKRMEDIYLEVINAKMKKDGKKSLSRAQLKRKMSFDWYLSAQECVDWGFADEIIEPKRRQA